MTEYTEQDYENCREMLRKIIQNESISRWDIFGNRKVINWILRNVYWTSTKYVKNDCRTK